MIIKPIITSILESIVNQIFYTNSNLKNINFNLDDKILNIQFKELSFPFICVFSKEKINILNCWKGHIDCNIYVSINELLKFYKNKNLISSINNKYFSINGDIYVFKQFLKFMSLIEFDLAEYLSPWLGDIISYNINNIIKYVINIIYRTLQFSHNYISQISIDQFNISLGRSEFFDFTKKITLINNSYKIISIRLLKLE